MDFHQPLILHLRTLCWILNGKGLSLSIPTYSYFSAIDLYNYLGDFTFSRNSRRAAGSQKCYPLQDEGVYRKPRSSSPCAILTLFQVPMSIKGPFIKPSLSIHIRWMVCQYFLFHEPVNQLAV